MVEKRDIGAGYPIVGMGQACGFGYAVRSNGDREALDFYKALLISHPKAAAGLKWVFTELMDTGQVLNDTRLRKIQGPIWEARHAASGARVFCFEHNGVWWATHGYIKDTRKTPPAEKQRALQIRREHLEKWGELQAKGKRDG